jgi:hypothetical protein
VTYRIDILWGWDQIAAALGVSVDTARANHQQEGLPVRIRGARRRRASALISSGRTRSTGPAC